MKAIFVPPSSTMKRERDRDLAERQKRGKTDLNETHERDDVNPSDVLHLNVGGKMLVVLRRTLCSFESSMLASRFSGRWDDSLQKDEKGHFFINEEYTLFKAMIDYLRKKETETDLYPAKPPDDLIFSNFDGGFTKYDFYRMLDYYGLLFHIYPVRLHGFHPPEDTQIESSACGANIRIQTNTTRKFRINPYEHGRSNPLTSFQIKLGEVESRLVGLEMSQDGYFDEEMCTFKIDTQEAIIRDNGTSYDLNSVKFKVGSVISVENIWTWSLDGNRLASTEYDGPFEPNGGCDVNFIISIHGKVTLMNFKYT